jgi:hypothetical protein
MTFVVGACSNALQQQAAHHRMTLSFYGRFKLQTKKLPFTGSRISHLNACTFIEHLPIHSMHTVVQHVNYTLGFLHESTPMFSLFPMGRGNKSQKSRRATTKKT